MKTSTYFNKKNILIIGAASGIGKAIVEQLKPYNSQLFLTARKRETLENCFGAETSSRYLELDINDTTRTKKTISDIKTNHGTIDIVINLAGYDVFKRFTSLSEVEINDTFSINLVSTISLVKNITEILFENKKGVFVNINAFLGGRLSMPYFSIDCASRAALANLFRSLRREFSQTDIRFVTFSPPGVDTAAEVGSRGKVWEANKIQLTPPWKIAHNFLQKLAQGKNEIILASTEERILALFDAYFPKLADLVFYRSFMINTTKVLSNEESLEN